MNESVALPVFFGLLLGAVLDFLFIACLKITWPIIYIPVYLALLKAISAYLSGKAGNRFFGLLSVSLISGALVSHLSFVGKKSTRTYLMIHTGRPAVALKASGSSKTLFISSDKLDAALAHSPPSDSVSVVFDVTLDYGCFRWFTVHSVAQVDISRDSDASWTWRDESPPKPPALDEPGAEDRRWPWCRYRSLY